MYAHRHGRGHSLGIYFRSRYNYMNTHMTCIYITSNEFTKILASPQTKRILGLAVNYGVTEKMGAIKQKC